MTKFLVSTRCVFAVVMLAGLTGCLSPQGDYGRQIAWPSMQTMGNAAKEAALDPVTWVPIVTAGALIAADVDHQWSQDLADEGAIFGDDEDDAEDASDNLRDLTTATYVLSALFAPSQTLQDKAKGLALGAGTMVLDGVLNQGLKDLTARERPDGSNDESFPSGHASKAASRAVMTLHNLEHYSLPQWANTTATIGMHSIALATGLARVEASKHHLSDVLVGYALGNFVANFTQRAFARGPDQSVAVQFKPVGDGGALTFTFALP